MIEIYKTIEGFPNYQVSNLGNVKSINYRHTNKEKVLNPSLRRNYYSVQLYNKNGLKVCNIHRLVAEAFIPNPDNLPVVNHKDGNIHNNSVDNLEWCTQGYNLKHAVDIGLMESQCKIRRKVTVKQGEHIILFDTMKDCATFFGFKKGWLQGQIRKHGCKFNYKGYKIEVHGRGTDK